MRHPTRSHALRNPALPRILPFTLYIAFLALGPWLAPHLPDGRWLYGLQVGTVAMALAILAPQFGELRGGWRSLGSDWLGSLLVGVAVFILWINLDQAWASMGESGGFDPRAADGSIDWPLAVLRLTGAALVVPVMEELFWRSFLMRWIDRSHFLDIRPETMTLRAVVISSLLFGVEHTLWLAGVLAGLAYAWLYQRRGNLWSPIVAHGVTNFLLGAWVLYSGNWQFW